MKKFFTEFKKFISKGNVVDLAVAVIIGAAFGKIVTSLVDDIITPLTSLLIGGIDFAELKWVIVSAGETTAEIALHYGRFLKNILDFLIIAFSIFVILRFYNKAKANIQKQFNESEQRLKRLLSNDGKKAAAENNGAENAKSAADVENGERKTAATNENLEILKEIRDLLNDKLTKK
ncbi:MAG: large conductance mechanosensitive channel protein MscL [Clostridiales bacterium]|jgi:large conductance mechanosensitive channel|nr:large conductance mechanosensitive channel protein MscL [Clostridiales bacterium]